ncbi:MAG: YIP1 family protein, partial [Acidobacteria bacterium]|nr:YIP1 family protein [Acidobacteriota bacterium]
MSETPAAPQAPTTGLSLMARIWGILSAPRETYADVVARPRWFGMMAVVILVTIVCTGGFLTTSVGQQAYLDNQVRATERFGGQVSEAQYAQMEKIGKYAAPITAASILVFSPLMTLVIAGILFAVFSAALGGDSSFKQVFTVVVHASAPTVVQQLFVTPLNYVRETMSSATNLAVFLPMLDEGSFLARLLGMIDLFLIWWMIVLSIGLGVLYKRK